MLKKVTILFLLLISATGFTWLMLMCMEVMPQTKITLYAAIILATRYRTSPVLLKRNCLAHFSQKLLQNFIFM